MNRATLFAVSCVLLGMGCLAALGTVMKTGRSRALAPVAPPAVRDPPSTCLQPAGGEKRAEVPTRSVADGGEEASRAEPDLEPLIAGALGDLWSDAEGQELGRKLLLTSSLGTRRVLLAALREHTALHGGGMEESERLALSSVLVSLYFEAADEGLTRDVRAAVAELVGEEVARELDAE